MLTRIITGSVTLPRALRREIPADLQAIVLKAIAKQPEHRYEDAASMAADLRRFCEGRTVAARRVGPLIKMARSARRNPVVATLSVALFTLAICSFALISSKWRDAVAENQRAEDNLSVALESMDQILEKFGSSWMAHPATNELANAPDAGANLEIQFAVSDYSAKVLQDALVFYDRFAVHNPTDPRIRHDTSKVHRRVGDIYQRLGQHDRAETAYRRSLSFFDSQPIDENLELTLEVASTQNQLGLSLFMASRFDDARHEYLRVNQLLAQSPHHRDSRCRTEQARTLTNMANCLSLMFRHREALECQKHAIQIIEGIVSEQAAEDSAGLIALAQAYRSYYRLAGFQRSRDRKASKENLDRIRNSGVKILEQLVQEYPNVPDYRCELAAMLEASRAGQPTRESQQRRIGDLQRAVELARELAADHPMIPRYRAVLARTLNSLARTLRVSQPARAESLFREAITIYRALSREFRDVPVYRTFLVWSMNEQIRHLRAGGRHQDAVSLIQEAIAEQSACLDLRPNHRFNQVRLGHLYRDLANAYKRMDKTVEAELAHEQSQQYLN